MPACVCLGQRRGSPSVVRVAGRPSMPSDSSKFGLNERAACVGLLGVVLFRNTLFQVLNILLFETINRGLEEPASIFQVITLLLSLWRIERVSIQSLHLGSL